MDTHAGPTHFDWAGYQKTAVAIAAGGGGGGAGVWNNRAGGGHGGDKKGGIGVKGNAGITTGGTQTEGGNCPGGPGQPYENSSPWGPKKLALILWPSGWPLHGGTDYPNYVRTNGQYQSRNYAGGGGGGYFGGGHGAYNLGGGGGSSFMSGSATKNGKVGVAATGRNGSLKPPGMSSSHYKQGTAPLPPHTLKAVTYHEQSHYCRFMLGHSLCPHHTPKAQSHCCRFMIGHSLGRIEMSHFITTFPFKLMNLFEIMWGRHCIRWA